MDRPHEVQSPILWGIVGGKKRRKDLLGSVSTAGRMVGESVEGERGGDLVANKTRTQLLERLILGGKEERKSYRPSTAIGRTLQKRGQA